MTKRLQVVLTNIEYGEVQRAARSHNMSVAAWVRQALGIVRRRGPSDFVAQKLEAIRVAVRLKYPTADIDTVQAEIESGYRAETIS